MSDRVVRTDLVDGGTGWRIGPNDTPARRGALVATLVLMVVAVVVLLAIGADPLLLVLVVVLAGGVGQPLLRGMLVHEEVRVRDSGLRVVQLVHLPGGRIAGSPDGVLLRPDDVERVGATPMSLRRLVGLGQGTIEVRRRATRDERRREREVDRDTHEDDREQDRRDHHVDATERKQRRERDASRADAREDRRTMHFGLGLAADEADAIATRIWETLRA